MYVPGGLHHVSKKQHVYGEGVHSTSGSVGWEIPFLTLTGIESKEVEREERKRIRKKVMGEKYG